MRKRKKLSGSKLAAKGKACNSSSHCHPRKKG